MQSVSLRELKSCSAALCFQPKDYVCCLARFRAPPRCSPAYLFSLMFTRSTLVAAAAPFLLGRGVRRSGRGQGMSRTLHRLTGQLTAVAPALGRNVPLEVVHPTSHQTSAFFSGSNGQKKNKEKNRCSGYEIGSFWTTAS
jgi:hypothetical protein